MDLARNMGQIPQDGQIASAKSNGLAMENHRNSLFWKGNSSTIGSYSTPTCPSAKHRYFFVQTVNSPWLCSTGEDLIVELFPLEKQQMPVFHVGDMCRFEVRYYCYSKKGNMCCRLVYPFLADGSKWLGSKTFQN